MEDPAFTLDGMTDEELGHLEYVMNSPSYARVFRPWLEGRRQMYINLLLHADPRYRVIYGGDEYLRASARNITVLLDFFEKIISETQDQRALRARDALGQEDLHREAVAQGIIRPAGVVKDDYPKDVEF